MDAIFLSIGNFTIRWYSICILVGVIFAYYFIAREAKRFKISADFCFNMMFWALIFGIIGARLYYVLFNFAMYKDNLLEILYVWNGGLAIHGGLIAGLLVVIFYAKKHQVNPLKIIDIVCVPILLAQAIGRWGNFFNQEAHGAATSIAYLRQLFVPEFIIKGMTIDGTTYFPTFYFESLACLASFLILLFIRRRKYIKVGTMTSGYLIFYGCIRFLIEMSRTDALMLGSLKMAQLVSIIMIFTGLALLLYINRSSKFENLYNDCENMTDFHLKT